MGEETVDELRGFGLRVAQPRHGYRFSLDPLLLCHFAAVREGEDGVDLGTGCGVIPLILARSAEGGGMSGVESREDMAELATRNVEMNGLSGRVKVLRSDVLHVKNLFPPSSFDLVVSNPPYRKRGSGRVSPKQGRDEARHESTASIPDFLAAAKYLVKLTGRICFIFHPSRLTEFLAEAAGLKLAVVRLRMVHGSAESEASMFLVEMVKGRKADTRVLPPLFVYDSDGEYSVEMERIFGESDSPQ